MQKSIFAHIIIGFQQDYYFFTLELSYGEINSLCFCFLLAVSLFYPQPKFNLKSKLGLLLIFLILFLGTMFVMLLSWTPVTSLLAHGFHSRYVLPALGLLPFIFGINYCKINTFKLDLYLICFIISFISFALIETMFLY